MTKAANCRCLEEVRPTAENSMASKCVEHERHTFEYERMLRDHESNNIRMKRVGEIRNRATSPFPSIAFHLIFLTTIQLTSPPTTWCHYTVVVSQLRQLLVSSSHILERDGQFLGLRPTYPYNKGCFHNVVRSKGGRCHYFFSSAIAAPLLC